MINDWINHLAYLTLLNSFLLQGEVTARLEGKEVLVWKQLIDNFSYLEWMTALILDKLSDQVSFVVFNVSFNCEWLVFVSIFLRRFLAVFLFFFAIVGHVCSIVWNLAPAEVSEQYNNLGALLFAVRVGKSECFKHFAHSLDGSHLDAASLRDHNTLKKCRETFLIDIIITLYSWDDVREDLPVTSLLIWIVESRSVQDVQACVVFHRELLSDCFRALAGNECHCLLERLAFPL